MKAYIAIGGLGCRILNDYQDNATTTAGELFYYLDTDCASLARIGNNKRTLLQLGSVSEHVAEGAGALRSVGKSVAKYSVLSDKMHDSFNLFKTMSDVELIFVTSSFGGTGSGSVFEIAEYLQALLWTPNHNRCKSCTIVAFNNCFSFLQNLSSKQKTLFETNTIQTVMEASTKVRSLDNNEIPLHFRKTFFHPYVDLYLIDEKEITDDDLYKILLLKPSSIKAIDQKRKYMVKQKLSSPEVFISYSSKDQETADLFVDTLKESGIESWISSRNIIEGSYPKQIIQAINGAKIFIVLLSRNSVSSPHVKNEIDRAFARINDGLKLLPFIIEECELDEDCQYYLCRQELFNGIVPPISKRINDIVDRIRSILE